MKNPNGFGCIKHLSGSRRNPWAFVVTESGKQLFSPRATVDRIAEGKATGRLK